MPAIAKKTIRSTKTVAAKKAPAKKVAAKSAKAKKPTATAPATKTAAQLRKIEAAKSARRATIQSKYKPVKTVTSSLAGFVEEVSRRSGVDSADVRKVYLAIESYLMGSLMPKSVGEFTLPRIAKIVNKKIPAKKGGQKVMSFGVERISKPKPATVRVKVRLLAAVKQVAIPA